MLSSAFVNDQAQLRILLVDIDSQALALLEAPLRNCGHDVRVASSRREALTVVYGFRPEVIFTGITLLESGGFELVRNLRSLPESKDSVIVVLTRHEAAMTPRIWAKFGFDKVLPNPPSVDEIVCVLTDVSAKRLSHLSLF